MSSPVIEMSSPVREAERIHKERPWPPGGEPHTVAERLAYKDGHAARERPDVPGLRVEMPTNRQFTNYNLSAFQGL